MLSYYAHIAWQIICPMLLGVMALMCVGTGLFTARTFGKFINKPTGTLEWLDYCCLMSGLFIGGMLTAPVSIVINIIVETKRLDR